MTVKQEYSTLVKSYLKKEVCLTDLKKIQTVPKVALSFVEDAKAFFSEQEFNYTKSSVNTKKIPTVHILVKDHKKVPPLLPLQVSIF